MSTFVHIYSGASDLCKMDRDAHAAAQGSWLCESCMNPRPGTGALDIQVRRSTVFDLPLSAVVECSTMIARQDVVELFPESILHQLHLGALLDETGQVVQGFVTVRADKEVIVRGSTSVSFRKCSECDRPIYYAGGKRYLCPTPENGRLVLGSDLSGLVFPDEVFADMGLEFPPNLVLVEKLPVVSPPKDGLPEIL